MKKRLFLRIILILLTFALAMMVLGADGVTHLYLNGVEGNTSIVYPATINVTAITDNGNVTIYQNGTVVNVSSENATYFPLLAAGTYNFTAVNNASGYNFTTSWLTVNRSISVVTLLINGSNGNASAEYGASFNITGILAQGDGNLSIFQNGTSLINGSSPLNISRQFAVNGVYNITLVYASTQNYTGNSTEHWLTITDATAPVININRTNSTTANIGGIILITTNWTETSLSNNDNMTCSLYVNSALNQTSTSNASWCNFTYATNIGNYPNLRFNVTAIDSSGNKGSSYYMNVSLDLCGSTLISNVTLQKNVNCTGGANGPAIGAAYVILDGAGYSILGAGTFIGILINSVNNAVVKNCVIQGFFTGVNITGTSTGGNVSATTFTNNSVGIQIQADGNTLTDNTISSSSVKGINTTAATTNWYITSRNTISNSNLTFNGSMFFSGNGVLDLISSYLTLNSTFLNNTGNVTALHMIRQNVIGNTSTEVSFKSDASTELALYLTENSSAVIIAAAEKTNISLAGYNLVKAVDILADAATRGNLTSAIVRLYYNTTDLALAGVDESTLRIYYYNESLASWVSEPVQGLYTAPNYYVWANVTHLSLFGLFGVLSVTTTQDTGGGGSEGHGTVVVTGGGTASQYIYNGEMDEGDKLSFTVGDKTYSLILTTVSTDSVKISFPGYKEVTLPTGKTTDVDINNDGTKDISVKPRYLDEKTADLSIIRLSAPKAVEPVPGNATLSAAPAEEAATSPEGAAPEAAPDAQEAKSSRLVLGIVVLAGLVALAGLIMTGLRKKKKRRY